MNSRISHRPGACGHSFHEAGFTLMELLIALTLLSLMLVMLFGGLRLGARSWDAVELHAAESGDQRLIWAFLRRTLMEMRGVYLINEDKRRIAFSGQQDAVEFVGLMPARLGPGGTYIIRVETQKAGKNRNLVMRRWLYHPEVLEGLKGVPPWTPLYERVGESIFRQDEDEKNTALYSEHVLVEGIDKLEIEYYGKIRGSKTSRWHEKWDEKSSMPSLINLTLETAKFTWPPLMVPLPAVSSGIGGAGGGFVPIETL